MLSNAYFLIVYFNWVPLAVAYRLLPSNLRSCRGWGFLLAATAVQLFAMVLHLYEARRLTGESDALYVWITPLLLVVLSVVPMVITATNMIHRRREKRTLEQTGPPAM